MKLPEASAVVTALAAPVRDSVAPLAPVIVPEILHVCTVKFKVALLLFVMVTLWLGGLNVRPFFVGVTV